MGEKPRQVLLVDSSPMFSGAQRMALRVLMALHNQGRIDLCAWAVGETAARLKTENVTVREDPLPFFMPGYGTASQHFRQARSLAPAMAEMVQGKVLYANGIHSGLPLALMGLKNQPVRVHVRDILRPRLPTRLTYLLLRRAGFSLAGVSGPVAANITALGGGPACVLYDPSLPLLPEREQAPTVTRVGFVGNLIHFKGADLLISAMGLLPDDLKQATTLHIVGPEMPGHEEYARRLPALAQEKGVRAEFLGRRENVAELMRGFDLFVLPSTWPDPFPGVVLEAITSDTPVVATAVGGVPEMLPPDTADQPAWLCPHTPQALAETLTAALRSSAAERRQRLDAARQHLQKNFAEEKILADTLHFLTTGKTP